MNLFRQTTVRMLHLCGVVLTAGGLLAMPVAALAEEPANASRCYSLQRLLDVEVAAEARMGELRKLISAAEAGESDANYYLGTFYRLGSDHPAAIVPREVGRARSFLSIAASKGKIMAMAGLAELALRDNKAVEAMVWAQAMAHFDQKHGESAEIDDYRRGYQAFLLRRSYQLLGRDTSALDEVRAHLSAFVDRYGEQIDAAHAASSDGQGTSPCAVVDEREWPIRIERTGSMHLIQLSRAAAEMHSPGYAMYMLEVAPDGRVAKVLTVDTLPDSAPARGLLSKVKGIRFNSVAGNAPMRYAYLPMSYSSGP